MSDDGETKRDEHGEMARFWAWRGVRNPCTKCNGKGSIMYGSTATWRGGIGGAAMTRGVCDGCWGSGDADRPWQDLRKDRDQLERRVASAAADLFAVRLGARFSGTHGALLALADEAGRLARGRKPRPDFFYEACVNLERLLHELVQASAAESAARDRRADAARDALAAERSKTETEGGGA